METSIADEIFEIENELPYLNPNSQKYYRFAERLFELSIHPKLTLSDEIELKDKFGLIDESHPRYLEKMRLGVMPSLREIYEFLMQDSD